MMECEVRLTRESDAASISAVILAALRTGIAAVERCRQPGR